MGFDRKHSQPSLPSLVLLIYHYFNCDDLNSINIRFSFAFPRSIRFVVAELGNLAKDYWNIFINILLVEQNIINISWNELNQLAA